MGYIFLEVHKHHHEAPILAYFKSAGCEDVPVPCPDFDAFLRANYYSCGQTVHPRCHILQHCGSEPILAPQASRTRVALCLLLLKSSLHRGLRPGPHRANNQMDPDGIDLPPAYSCPRPPSSITMGGALNRSHFSPLTVSSGFGMGGHA
jgi:hypothetical protein